MQSQPNVNLALPVSISQVHSIFFKFFSEAQYWNLVILSVDFGKWVLVSVLRLLEGLEGDPKFVQFCVGVTGFEVYAEKVRDFWRKFQYPKSDFVFCSLQ